MDLKFLHDLHLPENENVGVYSLYSYTLFNISESSLILLNDYNENFSLP